MTMLLTFAYLGASLIMFWHSAGSHGRRPLHRAMLYAFAFSTMCWGSARFLILFGADAEDWRWMIELGHAAMIAFAVMWIRSEVKVNRVIKSRSA